MTRLPHIVSFAWTRHRIAISIATVAFLSVTIAFAMKPLWIWGTTTTQVLEQSGIMQLVSVGFGVATFLVALLVWWGEVREDWEEILPKRLKVVFLFQGKPVMVCEDATVVAEGDIRGLAQQLGRQINNQRDLVIDPFMDVKPSQVAIIDGVWIKRFELHISLRKLPETVEFERAEKNNPSIICVRRLVNGQWKDDWVVEYQV